LLLNKNLTEIHILIADIIGLVGQGSNWYHKDLIVRLSKAQGEEYLESLQIGIAVLYIIALNKASLLAFALRFITEALL
jgi:hypothetical protein